MNEELLKITLQPHSSELYLFPISQTFPLIYNKAGFIGRHLSASYAPKEGDKEYPMFVEELSHLFEKYNVAGLVTLPNKTKTYCGFV